MDLSSLFLQAVWLGQILQTFWHKEQNISTMTKTSLTQWYLPSGIILLPNEFASGVLCLNFLEY